MNKLNTQKFMNLFNEILSDRSGNTIEKMLPEFAKKDLNQGDEIDLVNTHREEQLNLRLNGRNILFLKKVEKAKERILDGTFGVCEDCGNQISQKRLIARPTATMCITCQEDKERSEFSSINHRRDLKLVKNVSDLMETEETKSKRNYSNIDEIKFESVVDF